MSEGSRRARILALLAVETQKNWTDTLCSVAVRLSSTSGVALSIDTQSAPTGVFLASNHLASALEDTQIVLGEGPTVDATATRWPVLCDSIAATGRWPTFGPAALQHGAKAIYSFPLRVGMAQLGILTLHRSEFGPLSDDQLNDSLILADLATETLVLDQHRLLDESRSSPSTGNRSPDPVDEYLGANWVETHQATGMIAAQLGVSIDQALVRLRAYAFRRGETLGETGQAIVAREVTYEE